MRGNRECEVEGRLVRVGTTWGDETVVWLDPGEKVGLPFPLTCDGHQLAAIRKAAGEDRKGWVVLDVFVSRVGVMVTMKVGGRRESPAVGAAVPVVGAGVAPGRFYAYRLPNGHGGIVNRWDECSRIVTGVSEAQFHKFPTREAAEEWLRVKNGKVK